MLLGLQLGRVRIALLVDGARATGRIVAYEQRLLPRSRSSTGTLAFMPVVEFSTGTRVVRFTDWLGSSVAAGQNDTVPVRYRRVEPSVAMIDRPVGNWLPWGPTLALGLFLLLDAVRAWLRQRRSARDEARVLLTSVD